jgi:carbonic anhydrase
MVNLSNDKYRPKQRLSLVIMAAAFLGLTCLVLSACAAGPARAGNGAPSENGALSGSAEAPHWSYEGDTGTDYWYALDPAYRIARDGRSQSPIDIVTRDLTVDNALAAPLAAYRETRFEIENNGHTIELTPVSAGNRAVIDGDLYELRQFHFHAPGEHLVDGAPFAMELHLVHENAWGNLAVIGILIEEGSHNETLGEIFENLPRDKTGEGAAGPEVTINLADLFAGSGVMYRYEGSLTTPPCTEGVKWSILGQPITMSPAQIDAFRRLYRGNNRPVQNRYGRQVYEVKGQTAGD